MAKSHREDEGEPHERLGVMVWVTRMAFLKL